MCGSQLAQMNESCLYSVMGIGDPSGHIPPEWGPLDFGSHSLSSESGTLDLEVSILLDKGAVEKAPPSPGFYSRLFVVPKASGGY